MLFDLLAILSFLVVLLLLKRLVNIFPSLVACLWRGKENINLEASVKLAIDRNIIAMAMIVPFCLTACRFRLYDPSFTEGMSENAYLGICFGVFLLYLLLRQIVLWLFRPKSMPKKTYGTAAKASYTFFAILTLVLLAMGGILSFIDVDVHVVRTAMLWVSAVIYALLLLRKLQIFTLSCSVFAAFLYLCALEMIPTGILIVSALIF